MRNSFFSPYKSRRPTRNLVHKRLFKLPNIHVFIRGIWTFFVFFRIAKTSRVRIYDYATGREDQVILNKVQCSPFPKDGSI